MRSEEAESQQRGSPGSPDAAAPPGPHTSPPRIHNQRWPPQDRFRAQVTNEQGHTRHVKTMPGVEPQSSAGDEVIFCGTDDGGQSSVNTYMKRLAKSRAKLCQIVDWNCT